MKETIMKLQTYKLFEDGEVLVCRDDVLKALEQEPCDDVKTGYWKGYTKSAYHGCDEYGEPIWRDINVYHCSQCKRRTVIKEKYCPSCGAKMKEEVER